MPTVTTTDAMPEIGALVEVRGQRWVVSEKAAGGAASTLLDLQSVEDGRYGETLSVIWEVEPGRRLLPAGSLPDVTPHGFDAPDRLAAFLDAVRWSAVTSADVRTLQAPFRSGVAIEEYQLEPVARAVEAPRVNLLLADDVGLGKTIEAGLVALELLLRHRAHRIMIVCPAGLTVKWHDEMAEKFGLDFTMVDSAQLATLRRTHGSAANPFHVYPRTIVSLPWLRGPKAQRLLDEVLPSEDPGTKRFFDLLILDEAHHVAPAAPKQAYAVDSQQTKLIRKLSPHFEHRLFLSATPHNGYPESFTALLEIIDNQRFARGVDPDRTAQKETVVRRLKRDITEPDGSPRFLERDALALPVDYPAGEREIHALLSQFAALRRKRMTAQRGRRAADLVTLLLKKRLFSSPRAFAHTVGVYLQTLQTLQTLQAKKHAAHDSDAVPEWLDGFFDDVATLDDERLAEAEDDALGRSGRLQTEPTDTEIALLEQMEQRAIRQEALPDAKARELITYLEAVCRPDGVNWTNERVVVFTEYRDTQDWLADLLAQEGLPAGGWNGCTAGWTRTPGNSSGCPSRPTPPSTRCGSCWPPTRPARALTCMSTATGWSTTTSRSTPTSWSSGSAALTGTASATPRRSGISWASSGVTTPTPTRRTWSSSPGSPPRSPGWKKTSAGSTPCSPRPYSGACWARSATSTSTAPPPSTPAAAPPAR